METHLNVAHFQVRRHVFKEEKNWFYNFIVKSGVFFSIKKYFLALFKFASIGFLMFFLYFKEN